MFIDFEGIDGSGKTTLSNLLAERLRRLGYRVAHAREGGELRSPIARRIRELTRDSKLLEMSPRTEFFLNLARDAQQLEEVIAPALARGEVCISDRYLYSQLALSGGGRGLPGPALEPACELASQGLWPDLVILVDVDPELARLRKRLGKSKGERVPDSDSRKGLAGAGLAVRMREAFLAQARKDPSRWLIIENNDQPLHVLEQRLVDAVVARLEGRELPAQRTTPPSPMPVQVPASVDEVEEHFFRVLDGLEVREPQLAVWLLGGIPGFPAHQRRLGYVERFPGLTVRSLTGLDDEPARALRELLAEVVPQEVAMSLGSNPSPQAMALRERLYAHAPADVLAGLKNNDSPEAWALREHALREGRLSEVLCGLAGVDDEPAWAAREQGVRRGLYADVARSLTGLDSARADALRESLLGHDRLAVLRSVTGLDTPFARQLRVALEDKALKLVLRSLTGLSTDDAFALRERGAPLTKEALDSLDGLEDPRAWRLREAFVSRWPATVVSSLEGLPLTERAEALMLRALELTSSRLPVLRNAYRLVAASHLAALPSERSSQRMAGDDAPQPAL
ncbi:dTMP kinase [Archangium gephyra]|uniref:Thymidylate kinase n=1 Tax=Archangium gephyra TaxID=48 RepID=A0AAC8TIG9_9BACT|nr:dTMP kinase [Archangium gephyra]AKJ05581.1 Thymidylate kinase [Archangium gephyra]REG36261.1 dTMP kinase [Archangium gephyra]